MGSDSIVSKSLMSENSELVNKKHGQKERQVPEELAKKFAL
jgi:hypothetical protein